MQGDAPATADELIERLEEAGATLLAMGGRRPGPSPVMAQSQSWPVVHAAADAYGWSDARIRPAIPNSHAISRMDEAFGWISLIPQESHTLRRIVGARALVTPLTGKHLYTWWRLGIVLGADARAVRRWHAKGIAVILGALREREVQRAA